MPPANFSDETRIAVLETRQQSQDEWRLKTDTTLAKIGDALQMLARIDMQNEAMAKQVLELRTETRESFAAMHTRLQDGSDRMDDLDERTAAIEAAMPGLVATKNTLIDYAKEIIKLVLVAVVTGVLVKFGFKVPTGD